MREGPRASSASEAHCQTAVSGAEAYPGLWAKAAALALSIMKNHALVDGNKRLGWMATAVSLDINGSDVSVADNDDVYALVMDVAARNHTVAEVAEQLSRLAIATAEPVRSTAQDPIGIRWRRPVLSADWRVRSDACERFSPTTRC